MLPRLSLLIAALVSALCLVAAVPAAAAERHPLRAAARAVCALPVRAVSAWQVRPRVRYTDRRVEFTIEATRRSRPAEEAPLPSDNRPPCATTQPPHRTASPALSPSRPPCPNGLCPR